MDKGSKGSANDKKKQRQILPVLPDLPKESECKVSTGIRLALGQAEAGRCLDSRRTDGPTDRQTDRQTDG